MIFEQGTFQTKEGTTPEQLARKRQQIRDMIGQYGTARYAGQGMAHMLTGALNGFKEHKYNKYEGEQREKADEVFEGASGTKGYEDALANPWLTPEQKRVISMRMQREQQEAARAASAGRAAAGHAQTEADRAASMDLMTQYLGSLGGGGGQPAPAQFDPVDSRNWALGNNGGPTVQAGAAVDRDVMQVPAPTPDALRYFGGDSVQGGQGDDLLGGGGDDRMGGQAPALSPMAQQLSAFDAYTGYKSSEPAPQQAAPEPNYRPVQQAAPQPQGIDPAMATQILMDPRMPKEIKQMVMAQFSQPEPEPTDDIREYQFARSQGYDGSFTEFMGAVRSAGATRIENNLGAGETAFQKKTGEGLAAEAGGIVQSGLAAQRNLGTLQNLEAALADAPQGAMGEWARIAGNLGIKTEGSSAVETVTAIVNQLVPMQRPPGSGQMSDRDVQLFVESLPRLINTPQGNRQIIDTMRSIAEYDTARMQVARRLQLGQIGVEQYNQDLAALGNPLANYAKPQPAPQGGAPSARAPSPGGGWNGPTLAEVQQMDPMSRAAMMSAYDARDMPDDILQLIAENGG